MSQCSGGSNPVLETHEIAASLTSFAPRNDARKTMNRDIKKQLNSFAAALKESAVFDRAAKEDARARLMAIATSSGKISESKNANIFPVLNSLFSILSTHQLFCARVRFAAKSVLVTAIAVPLVLGGWMTGVNAAMDSLPGDFLYRLKIAGERAQVALVAGADKKLKLKTEFAGRRLEEVTKLAEAHLPAKDKKTTEAVKNFNREIETVSRHLDELKQSEPEKAVEAARFIDRKT